LIGSASLSLMGGVLLSGSCVGRNLLPIGSGYISLCSLLADEFAPAAGVFNFFPQRFFFSKNRLPNFVSFFLQLPMTVSSRPIAQIMLG